MSSFNARLRLPGRSKLPTGVEVDIGHERMTLTAADRTVGVWPLEELDVSSRTDGFHIRVDGEEIVLNVTDSKRFAAELGIDKRPRRPALVKADQAAHTRRSPAESRQSTLPKTNGAIKSRRPAAKTTPEPEPLDDVQHRISEIAMALTSDSVSPAEAFAEWLKLVKEINRRHGQGSMPSDLFYLLNSQLLDLIPDPTSDHI